MKIINEEKLKPVITSKQVMIENKPITNVIYDDDGDWLCFHAYTIKEDDAYIVSIEQIIEHDKTLLSEFVFITIEQPKLIRNIRV